MTDAPQSSPSALAANVGVSSGDLLAEPVKVINIGLEEFATDLAQQGAAVVHVVWTPPAGGDPDLAALLVKLGA